MQRSLLSMLICVFAAVSIAAQTTAFSYQGILQSGGSPANGSFDFEFKLFDLVSAGTQQGSAAQRLNVAVANGVFAVSLDFGAGTLPGADRFLEIAVRTAGGGAFTTLTPRQKITSNPYSVKSLAADSATNATQLGGVAASQYIKFDANGRVGIGTASPGAGLEISGTGIGAQQRITDTASGNSLVLQSGAGGNLKVTGYNFGTSTAVPLFIGVDAANTMLNPNGGYVGIGTADPLATLHIKSLNGSLPFVETSSGTYSGYNFRSGPGGVWNVGTQDNFAGGAFIFRRQTFIPMVISTIGNLGINTIDPQRLLHVNGRARIGSIPLEASTAAVCFNALGDLVQCGGSSLQWKTDVRPFDLGLETILRLRPINFKWKESGKNDFGLGAESVAQVAPELTFADENGDVKGVKYDHLNVVFINAIKEQQSLIETQRREIDALKKLVCRSNRRAEICREKKL